MSCSRSLFPTITSVLSAAHIWESLRLRVFPSGSVALSRWCWPQVMVVQERGITGSSSHMTYCATQHMPLVLVLLVPWDNNDQQGLMHSSSSVDFTEKPIADNNGMDDNHPLFQPCCVWSVGKELTF